MEPNKSNVTPQAEAKPSHPVAVLSAERTRLEGQIDQLSASIDKQREQRTVLQDKLTDVKSSIARLTTAPHPTTK